MMSPQPPTIPGVHTGPVCAPCPCGSVITEPVLGVFVMYGFPLEPVPWHTSTDAIGTPSTGTTLGATAALALPPPTQPADRAMSATAETTPASRDLVTVK